MPENSLTFYDKFFGYFKNQYGDYDWYSDDLRRGSFQDWRHFLWIIAVVIISVTLYRYVRNNKEKGKSIVLFLSITLLLGRITLVAFPVILGGLAPWGRIIPFHQCAVMGIVLPLVIFFDYKPLQQPVYVISMMGGLASIAFAAYFKSAFQNYYFYEGILSHTLLLLIPLLEIARGNFRLDFKKSWTVLVGMMVLIGWASLANDVFFPGKNTNYMYLKRNGFPNEFAGQYYFAIYVLIFAIVFGLIYAIPAIYRRYILGRSNNQVYN